MGSNFQDILKRLRRIEGRVTGIRKMQEGGRYCIDVLDQISAARVGLEATALLILRGPRQRVRTRGDRRR